MSKVLKHLQANKLVHLDIKTDYTCHLLSLYCSLTRHLDTLYKFSEQEIVTAAETVETEGPQCTQPLYRAAGCDHELVLHSSVALSTAGTKATIIIFRHPPNSPPS